MAFYLNSEFVSRSKRYWLLRIYFVFVTKNYNCSSVSRVKIGGITFYIK